MGVCGFTRGQDDWVERKAARPVRQHRGLEVRCQLQLGPTTNASIEDFAQCVLADGNCSPEICNFINVLEKTQIGQGCVSINEAL